MNGLEIRSAEAVELDEIVGALVQPAYFADRLDRQRTRLGLLLVAWLDRRPVGDVYLWCEPAFEEIVVRHLPGVPLLTHLEVLPNHRNRGIGTQLVVHAETHLRDRGFTRVALSVGEENKNARRLYERLGYVEWDHGCLTTISEVFGPDGTVRKVADATKSRLMVKQLAQTP